MLGLLQMLLHGTAHWHISHLRGMPPCALWGNSHGLHTFRSPPGQQTCLLKHGTIRENHNWRLFGVRTRNFRDLSASLR